MTGTYLQQMRRTPSTAWMVRAACVGDRDFDVDYATDVQNLAVRAAANRCREVCSRCCVNAECLAWAMDTHEPHGIWAGLTPPQRASIRRHHDRAARA